MAIIPEKELELEIWGDIEDTPQLDLLVAIMEDMPDEALMRKMERHC